MLTMLIVNFLHHCGCVCTVGTYNNVSVAGAKGENTVWGWGQVSATWVGVPQKVREMSGKCRGFLH